MLKNEPKIFEPMSIVMIMSMETKIFGQFVTILWRIFYDGRFSMILTNLEIINEQLIHLNAIRPLKKIKIFLLAFGVFIHFSAHMIRPIDIIINVKSFGYIDRVMIIIV